MPVRLDFDRERLAAVCRRWHIKRLWFFGSVVREDFSSTSDIDVLYEFEEGMTPGWEIVDVVDDLKSVLGRDIDFVPAKYLNRWMRPRVWREAELQYAA